MSQKNLETYFDFAENSYLYFKFAYENGIVANDMASQSQNICERYLKHIVETYSIPKNSEENNKKTDILHAHNLKKIINYIKNDMKLSMDKEEERDILMSDSFYFTSRYPGDDSITVTKENIDDCYKAIVSCRNVTLSLINEKENNKTTDKDENKDDENDLDSDDLIGLE